MSKPTVLDKVKQGKEEMMPSGRDDAINRRIDQREKKRKEREITIRTRCDGQSKLSATHSFAFTVHQVKFRLKDLQSVS